MLLLGLCGRARAGKTEAAHGIRGYCENVTGDSCKIFDIGAKILDHCIKNKLLPSKKRGDLSAEDLAVLVKEGQRLRQECGEDFLIRAIEADINKSRPKVAIVPNIRYLNELAWVRSRRGFVIKVEALNYDGSDYISLDRDPNDISETGLHNVNADFFIKAKRGESALLSDYAITIYEHVRGIYA